MKVTNGIRVKAPDNSIIGHLPSITATMKGMGQNPPGEAYPRTSVDSLVTSLSNSERSRRWDLRKSVRIATWNVLTLSKTGYQVTLAKEMARLKVDVIGVTEARIPDCGRRDVEDSTILFSGGTTRTHGVALLLRETRQTLAQILVTDISKAFDSTLNSSTWSSVHCGCLCSN